MNEQRIRLLGMVAIMAIQACSTTKPVVTTLSYDPPGATTESKPLDPHHKRMIGAGDPVVWVDNRFDGARFSDFYAVNDTLFRVVIRPENAPINRSAYYGFRIWADSRRSAWVELSYESGSHRYVPKLSVDGKRWSVLDSSALHRDREAGTAWFRMDVDREPTWVTAQPLFTSSDMNNWLASLGLEPGIIGITHEGRPLVKVVVNETGNPAAPAIVLMTRQHPPELTGEIAFRTFVETVLSDDEHMSALRRTHQVILYPMMNPDGVDGGHWRHNAGGVDLNRDWGPFNQPETQAVRDHVRQFVADGGSIVFMLDFHSTSYDVFYTISRVEERSGLSDRWLDGIRQRVPGYVIRDEPSGTAPTISKNWFFREFNTVGVTYEVGDATSESLIQDVARAAANSLAHLLNPIP